MIFVLSSVLEMRHGGSLCIHVVFISPDLEISKKLNFVLALCFHFFFN